MSWTDERLDDLNRKVDRIDKKVDGLSREMHAEFRAVRAAVNGRFDSLQKMMMMMFATTTGTILAGFVSIFAAG